MFKPCKTFHSTTKLSKERPIVLLLYNHDLDLSIQAVKLCKLTGVFVLICSPHWSQKTQTRDRSVKRSLTTYVNRACDACVTKHSGTA